MQESGTDNSSSLISRARGGDRQCLEQLLTAYRPYLKMIARLRRDARLRSKRLDPRLATRSAGPMSTLVPGDRIRIALPAGMPDRFS